MLPFWLSIALLSLLQGVVVALVRPLSAAWPVRLRSPRWALVPPLSVIAFVVVVRAAQSASAEGLTYLALVAVPVLAALALAGLCAGGTPRRALLLAPLFALAWADRRGLAGEGAAVALSALSCVALGSLLGALTPARWLAAGILAMALADSALVVSDLLQRPNNALNAAHPAAGLPRLQSAVFGSAVMGYGDLFIAGALGGLLAFAPRRRRLGTAALAALCALLFDLLFFAVSELPATVPVAAAMLLSALATRRAGATPPRAPAAPSPPRPAVPQRSPAARRSPAR